MPTLKKFSITGTVGNLEGIAHIPDSAPRAIAVVAHPLPTMGGTMENKVAVTLAVNGKKCHTSPIVFMGERSCR